MIRITGNGPAVHPGPRVPSASAAFRGADPAEASLQSAAGSPDALKLGWSAVLLVLAGAFYNSLLAFLNARGLYVGLPLVIVSELIVLGAAALILLRSGIGQGDGPALLLFAVFLADAFVVSLISGELFIDLARNAAIICIFMMIGARVEERTIRRTFAVISGLVLAFLVLEIVSVTSYAALLEPGRYFEQTRGISRFELDEIGLFANALGFDDRFTILNLVGHRTSSLFLEQVSLANFGTVIAIFLVAMWQQISKIERAAYIFLLILILVTNNSRTALAISLIAPLVYLVAPKLPRLLTLALMPAILLCAWLVTISFPPTKQDTLVGRVGQTIRSLGDVDLIALVGGRAPQAIEFADSGYTYLIYGGSFVALIVMWLFLSLIASGSSDARKRCSLMLGIYFFGNLLIGGSAVFTIKVAALLWMLIGFMRKDGRDEPAHRPLGRSSPRHAAPSMRPMQMGPGARC